MQRFAQHWQMESDFVIEAAFYSEANLQQVDTLKWLSRVPQTLSAAQALIASEPEGVQRCINILHVLGYAEATSWSRPQPADRVGEIVRVLIKTVIVER